MGQLHCELGVVQWAFPNPSVKVRQGPLYTRVLNLMNYIFQNETISNSRQSRPYVIEGSLWWWYIGKARSAWPLSHLRAHESLETDESHTLASFLPKYHEHGTHTVCCKIIHWDELSHTCTRKPMFASRWRKMSQHEWFYFVTNIYRVLWLHPCANFVLRQLRDKYDVQLAGLKHSRGPWERVHQEPLLST